MSSFQFLAQKIFGRHSKEKQYDLWTPKEYQARRTQQTG